MPDRTLRAILTGDSAGMVKAFGEGSAAADAAAADMETSFDRGTSKVGGLLSHVGNTMSNYGLPFSESVKKMGDQLDEAKSKGQGFSQAMSDLGKVTLLAGGAGFLAIAAGSVEMADKFDEATASMDTAIKNNGGNLDKLQPSIDKTYASMAKLGFNSTETTQALTPLITATGSTKTALGDMSLAADLARMKHTSLSDAAAALTKVYGGSTRALTQMGLNLDIGSAKLTSLHTATQTVTDDQIKLQQTQQEVNDGTLKGAAGAIALQNAHIALSNATEKVEMDMGTTAKIMDTLRDKTHGAADAFGQTLPGDVDTARAELHNLGSEFGDFLDPKIKDVINDVTTVVYWFEQHKEVAEALAGVIGGVLAVAVGIYLVNVGQKMVTATSNAITSIQNLGTWLGNLGTSSDTASGKVATLGTTSEVTGGEMATAGTEAEVAGGKIATAGDAAETAGGKIGTAGLAGEMGTAETGATNLAEEAGSGGLMGILGPLGIAAGGAAIGFQALASHMLQVPTDSLDASLSKAKTELGQLPTDNLYQLGTAVDQARQQIDKTAGSVANLKKFIALPEDDPVGEKDLKDAKALYDRYTSLMDQQNQYRDNLQVLGTQFGLTNVQVQQLAATTGVNLKAALDPTQVGIMRSALGTLGQGVGAVSTDLSGMSTTAQNAFIAIQSNAKAALGNETTWAALGAGMDQGLAAGIGGSASLVSLAAAGVANSAIQAAAHAVNAHSPSLKAMEIGGYIGDGLALGILGKAASVTAASTELAKGALDGLSGTPGAAVGLGQAAAMGAAGAAGPAGSAPVSGDLHISLEINGQTFANATWSDFRQVLLQNKRAFVSLGLD